MPALKAAVCAFLAAAAALAASAQTPGPPGSPQILVGTDAQGVAHHQPADWPAAAGSWNGRGARFVPAGRKLVFETYREDVRGGSVQAPSGEIGRSEFERTFVAGRATGTIDSFGTTVLYVADADGSNPSCVGCADVRDGQNGVRIYQTRPSANGDPQIPARWRGGVVYANQNKDLAAWTPDGRWIIASIEMSRHALAHRYGNGETAMFNDIWAISADRRTWVRLTDFAATWPFVYNSVPLPVPSSDPRRCPTGRQYATAKDPHPFDAYACSRPGQPPPVIGIMRPTLGNVVHAGGRAPIAWGERVGLDARYTWGGTLQLARADVVLADGLPALVDYRRNLTPTPLHPQGEDIWRNPGGEQVVGAGYEPWAFSSDDACLAFATDVFLSTSGPGVAPQISPTSEAFTDVGVLCDGAKPGLVDVTDFDPVVYGYQPNALPGAAKYLGHWEEPSVFATDRTGREFVVFGSSADLEPPWNPLRNAQTFGLETWIIPLDRSSPAVRLTHYNDPSHRIWAYPTTYDPTDHAVYLTVILHPSGDPNPAGAIYRLEIHPSG